jgi:hypothetical protein
MRGNELFDISNGICPRVARIWIATPLNVVFDFASASSRLQYFFDNVKVVYVFCDSLNFALVESSFYRLIGGVFEGVSNGLRWMSTADGEYFF